MKVVIIGGVAGGASTAARLRRLAENAQIVMFERGQEISYANCGIPYHIGGVINDRGQLVVVEKEKFEKLFNVDVRISSEVVAIDRLNKRVKVRDLANNNEYEESYDKLVLSPGGYPIRLPIPGINDPRIFTIRDLADMDQIKRALETDRPKKALIVGAGFIGLEIAENLHRLGLMVSVVELAGQVMNLLDFELAAAIHQQLKTKKVELYLSDAVKEFSTTQGLEAVLQSGRRIKADLVILAIGVKPEVRLAKEAGLELGLLGGIKINPGMQTSDQDIYALGDATEIKDSVCECPALIPLANSANKQGRIVADNLCGGQSKYDGTPGTAIAKVFDLVVAITGASEKKLKKMGLPYAKVYLQPSSHAGYYPDAFPLLMKILYDPNDGRLLGAQIVGSDGVDKRIDIIAALVQLQKSVYDLAKLELAYAPPFSSAKDPVNLAGMIAVNQLNGNNASVYWDEIPGLLAEGAFFLDVRTELENNLGQIEGAVNIPLEAIRSRLAEIPRDRKVIVYCNQGKSGYFALCLLRQRGYANVYNLAGGYKLYKITALRQENVGIFEGVFVDKTDESRQAPVSGGRLFKIDASGLQCPGPIMRLAEALNGKLDGDIIEVVATDPGFNNDIAVWCATTGNILISVADQDRKLVARVQKGSRQTGPVSGELPHDKTIVVFSSDLDRAIAAFVIANGAASMGRKVTLFFTFWGLNILRRREPVKVKKDLFEKMFGFMMPRGSLALPLSRMNFFGIGPWLIRYIMRRKNIDSLETFINSALQAGVKLVACQMTMDMMGIKKEELIDGVAIGGVAAYLGAAETADTNLFI